MDILLIQPPIRDFYLTAKRTIPYGLACIAASLKQAGFSVDILDGLATGKSKPVPLPHEMSYLDEFYGRPDISPFCLFHGYRHFGYSFQYLEKRILESKAFLVGISALFTAYSEEPKKIAGIVKKSLPDAFVVVGGHHPTSLPEDAINWNSVDFCIRGDGEAALPKLAKALKHGGNVSAVPGIVFRKPDGEVHVSPPAVSENLDALPLPDLSLIKNAYYSRGKNASTVVITSRGCPFTCSYCSFGNRRLYPYRQRSVNSVMKEIDEDLKKHGTRFIDFEDENLSANKKWFIKLLNEIRSEFGDKDLELRAMNGLYPPSLDEELVVAMKRAGFKTLNLSLATTCREQLKRFQRRDVRKAFENCLDIAEKHSLNAVGYVICGAPGQKAEQSLEDLIYLARHRVLAGLSVFYPAPGSKDFTTLKTIGILPPNQSLFRSSTIPLSHTTTRLESATLIRLSRIVNYMKYTIDRGRPLPLPARIVKNDLPSTMDRGEIGDVLLSAFLEDGGIRGVTTDNRIFFHRIDLPLVLKFLERLKGISVRGTRGV